MFADDGSHDDGRRPSDGPSGLEVDALATGQGAGDRPAGPEPVTPDPATPEPARPGPPVTGDEAVDEAMERLAQAQSGTFAERIESGEHAHRSLQSRLGGLGGA
jgi:hypothetical protein